MSYCRFTDDSDVYAYDCDGGVQIWVTKRGFDRLCNTYGDAYRYLLQLRDVHGLSVPDYAIDALKADAMEEVSRFTGMPELAALAEENARLRSCLSDDAENARQIMGENTELRELIQKVWKWEKNGCHKCPLESDCEADSVYDGDCGMAVEIEKEMRKLGIEVE
ncbi:MAG: hypothetical protein IKG21_13050 [Atopobiaceae bacterium]|nr:hypothetical protein [Atopobiaceae bacterium]